MLESERNLLLEKIEEWQKKARSEEDPFNRYVSIFTAYNIFYNLYAKTKNPNLKDLTYNNTKRAIGTLDLIRCKDMVQFLKNDIEDYLTIIPIFREEYWGRKHKVAISKTLKEVYKEGDKEKTIEMLLKWLYKVRCNLVHGEKSYNEGSQKNLLQKSSSLLDKVLEHLMENYRQLHLK